MNSRMRSVLISFIESMGVVTENKSSGGSMNVNLLTMLPHDDVASQCMREGWTSYGVGRYSMVVNTADETDEPIDAHSDHMDPALELPMTLA